MPLVLLNSRNIQLKSYVVQSITDEVKPKRISYRFNEPSLNVRQGAIEKALSERDRLLNLYDGERLIDKIKLYLEFATDRVEQNCQPTRSKIYLLNGASNNNDQLQWLDVERVLWVSSAQPQAVREVDDGNRIWVVIDQLFSELYYFYY